MRPLLDDDVFVVADGPPPWPMPAFMRVVSDVPAGPDVTRLDATATAGRDVLGGYAAHFALRRALEAEHAGGRPLPPTVVLARCDLIASTRLGRTRTPAQILELGEHDVRPGPGTVVVAGTVALPGVLVHDAGAHHVQDLMRLMADAVDSGVADQFEVAEFLTRTRVVATPTVGAFPTDWYLQTMTALERVTTVFLDRHPAHDRPLDACLARLHALLLTRLVAGRPDAALLCHDPIVVAAR